MRPPHTAKYFAKPGTSSQVVDVKLDGLEGLDSESSIPSPLFMQSARDKLRRSGIAGSGAAGVGSVRGGTGLHDFDNGTIQSSPTMPDSDTSALSDKVHWISGSRPFPGSVTHGWETPIPRIVPWVAVVGDHFFRPHVCGVLRGMKPLRPSQAGAIAAANTEKSSADAGSPGI
ncbi:hypothetical protein B0H14DRAFT_2615898 [Mycena olivaceomarginata]|nr:hypothetical protein B0H14DRAFT_2615898 [Mycena olivaceomarginata]